MKINIFFITDFSTITLAALKPYLKFLPESKLKKYYQAPSNKKIYILLSFLFLWYVLKIKLNQTSPPQLVFGKNNKPYLKNNEIFFNLSHTKNLIACAINSQEVGLDVELIKPINPNLMRKICTEEEYLVCCNSKNRFLTFFEIWTKKESFVKLNSGDIFSSFKKINSLNLKNTQTFNLKSFMFSISSKTKKPYELFKISPNFYNNLKLT